MTDLLKEFEECAGEIIEQDLGRKAILIDPDGKKYTKSALDPLEDLKCTIFQESHKIDVRTGFENLVDMPVAVFRLASLARIPKAGETWFVRVPKAVFGDESEMISYTLSGPPIPAKTIGFINLRLRKTSQV